jgi:hypothetical protein
MSSSKTCLHVWLEHVLYQGRTEVTGSRCLMDIADWQGFHAVEGWTSLMADVDGVAIQADSRSHSDSDAHTLLASDQRWPLERF